MIVVTRLNDSQFAVNPDLIERIHANPDTTLVMVDGAKYIVTESMPEVIEMIADYRARVINLARRLDAPIVEYGVTQLGLVPPPNDDNSQPGNAHNAGNGDTGIAETLTLRPRKN